MVDCWYGGSETMTEEEQAPCDSRYDANRGSSEVQEAEESEPVHQMDEEDALGLGIRDDPAVDFQDELKYLVL
jgi:hypothetical protein